MILMIVNLDLCPKMRTYLRLFLMHWRMWIHLFEDGRHWINPLVLRHQVHHFGHCVPVFPSSGEVEISHLYHILIHEFLQVYEQKFSSGFLSKNKFWWHSLLGICYLKLTLLSLFFIWSRTLILIFNYFI